MDLLFSSDTNKMKSLSCSNTTIQVQTLSESRARAESKRKSWETTTICKHNTRIKQTNLEEDYRNRLFEISPLKFQREVNYEKLVVANWTGYNPVSKKQKKKDKSKTNLFWFFKN